MGDRGSGPKLLGPQLDRAAGVLVAQACGDALGAGYEFGPPLPGDTPVGMIGGGLGPFEPGEWTDDTATALCVAQVAATGADLREPAALDDVARGFVTWSRSAKDIGVHTSQVLRLPVGEVTADALTARARTASAAGRGEGNGSLMRTAPVGIAFLEDEAATVDVARLVSELTHPAERAVEACVLWSLAIRHAVEHGTFEGLWAALDALPVGSRDFWAQRLREAESSSPVAFSAQNGWVVGAAGRLVGHHHHPRPSG